MCKLVEFQTAQNVFTVRNRLFIERKLNHNLKGFLHNHEYAYDVIIWLALVFPQAFILEFNLAEYKVRVEHIVVNVKIRITFRHKIV